MKSTPRASTLSRLAGQALAVLPALASADIVVPHDHPLIPVGLRPGDSFHLIFVTSTQVQRDLVDGTDDGSDNSTTAQWDAHVNALAAASTLPGGMGDIDWFAMVSVDNLSDGAPGIAAKDHAVVSAPVYRMDGTLVATGSSDLWDGSIAAPVIITEKGTNLGSGLGVYFETWSGDASNYISAGVIGIYPLGNGGNSAQVGFADQSGGGWFSYAQHVRRGPNDSRRVYALSERITIAIPADSDGDGLPDWFEAAHTETNSTTELVPGSDLDFDGLSALQEYQAITPLDAADPDTDGDGLLDGASIALTNSDPRYLGWVAEGIAYSDSGPTRTFRGEAAMGTDPVVADTDGDDLRDGVESDTGVWISVNDTGTDPLDTDSDNDALPDGVETNSGVLVDRKTDSGTNPVIADTDGDGAGDWYEITASFTSPFLAGEKPNIPYPLSPHNGAPQAADKPVKVFILAGQSNMVGIGYVNGSKPGSLNTITRVDGKFPNLLDGSRNYLPREDVWYEGVNTATARKWLAPGCGSGSDMIGPELGFGQVMGWFHDEPVLIIKASQGNRGLGWAILPPGSGAFNWSDGKTYAGYGDSPQSWATGSTPASTDFYGGWEFDRFFKKEADWARPGAEPMYNVADVLDEFDTKFPQWAAQGFEIAGYAWFQGHWDQGEPYASKYEQNLVRLIDEVRGYYENRYPGKVVEDAPFAVATIGFGGVPYTPETNPSAKVHAAQLAVGDPAKHPAFAGNVKSIDTLPYWRETDESPGVQGYHYNNNAETYMLVGDALGRLMVDMLEGEDVYPPVPNPMMFLIPPSAVDATTIGMVATTATDRSGPVEYFFECTAGGGPDSGWQRSPSYIVGGLAPGATLTYRVKARDAMTPVANETLWSPVGSATAAADVTAPAPDSMAFASPPAASGETTITMTAATALDINGVEYFFECTAGGGPDSGWQDSPVFNATGLTTGVTYTYVVRARDKSSARNVTADSPAASASPVPVPDITPPASNYLDPVNGATGVPADATLTLGFDEDVTAGSGFITLKNLGNSTQTQIAVNDSSQVVFSGDTVTITPAGGFIEGGTYAVRIDATAIEDLAGNDFAGIANDSTWSFTIADNTAPLATSFSPANGTADVLPTAPLVITFSEPVVRGTGPVTIRNVSDSSETVIDVTDTARVSIAGPTVTITPAAAFAQQKLHAIRIAAGAFTDAAGNPFAGIADDGTWSFTTRLVVGATSIPLNDFETALDPWVPNSVATTGLYIHQTQLQPADDTATNFAAAGSRAASLGKSGGAIVSPALDLSGGGDTESLTVDLDFVWHNGSTTRRAFVEYSNDGGTNWFTVAMMQIGAASAGSNKTAYSGTVTIKEGTSAVTRTGNFAAVTLTGHVAWNSSARFTNNSKVRIRNLASAGADARLFIDNLSVASTIVPPVAGDPFDNWADGFPALTDPDPTRDFDGGSLPTGIEWVVGGDPTDGSDDAGLAPVIDTTTDPDGKLLFNFRRTTAAKNDANTSIAVQYGSALSGWTNAVHHGTGANQITITASPAGPGLELVSVALPPSLAGDGRLFVRLNVAVTSN